MKLMLFRYYSEKKRLFFTKIKNINIEDGRNIAFEG